MIFCRYLNLCLENKLLNLSKHEFAKVKFVSLGNDIKILKQQISERWMNAFGTDWSMEYDIETILLKCGADKDNVKQWKKLNWF